MDYDELDPGIREVVRRLNEAGFITTDSGDGVSKAELIASGDAMDFPHVFITLELRNFAHECQKLINYLHECGVTVLPVGHGYLTAASIQVTYDPVDGSMFALLAGVDDSRLTAH